MQNPSNPSISPIKYQFHLNSSPSPPYVSHIQTHFCFLTILMDVSGNSSALIPLLFHSGSPPSHEKSNRLKRPFTVISQASTKRRSLGEKNKYSVHKYRLQQCPTIDHHIEPLTFFGGWTSDLFVIDAGSALLAGSASPLRFKQSTTWSEEIVVNDLSQMSWLFPHINYVGNKGTGNGAINTPLLLTRHGLQQHKQSKLSNSALLGDLTNLVPGSVEISGRIFKDSPLPKSSPSDLSLVVVGTGERAFKADSTTMVTTVMQPSEARKPCFVSMFRNHDDVASLKEFFTILRYT